jgi:hypothetical protein
VNVITQKSTEMIVRNLTDPFSEQILLCQLPSTLICRKPTFWFCPSEMLEIEDRENAISNLGKVPLKTLLYRS